MNTIFWLAVAFGIFSFAVMVCQAVEYSKLNLLEQLYSRPHKWPFPVFLACIVIALTI